MSVGMVTTITVDGVNFNFAPDTVDVDPESNERVVSTLGDTCLYRDVMLAGLPDIEERFRSISFPIGGLETDAERKYAQLLRVQGGFHRLALWVPERMIYTAIQGQILFYFGRRRRDAGIALGRTTEFPLAITRNTTSQTIVLVSAEVPTTPTSGTCNVSTNAVTSGVYRDYSTFALSACAAGDVIEVTTHPELRVYVERPRIGYKSITERHDLVFVER